MRRDEAASTAEVHRSVSADLQIVTLRRSSCEEHFVTAVRIGDEPPEAMFERAAGAVRDRRAGVVSQEVFGLRERNGSGTGKLTATLGEVAWPVTWVENGDLDNVGGTQLWAVTGAQVEPLRMGDRVLGCLFEDDHAQYCRLGGLVSADASQPRDAQARDVFVQMEAGLRTTGMNFGHVLRTWFCNDDILSWYGQFNTARDTFFRERGVFDGLVPASTGVGGRNPAGAALTCGLLAVRAKGQEAQAIAVPSPLQCPALEYGSSFSRAVEFATPDHRRLFVSGTASIAPEGHTVHGGDATGQLALTMEVVEAILASRDMGWADVSRAIAYFKHSEDIPALGGYCAEHGIQALPAVLVNDDICRDDLLFEIELDAVAGARRIPD